MDLALEHFLGSEEFVKRIYDVIEQMERQKRILTTHFLTPSEALIVERICGNTIRYIKDGGYENAQRVRMMFTPYESEETIPISIVKASYNPNFGSLDHRDFLGALMNIGLEREKIGDLLIIEHDLYAICCQDVENYICCNLTKIKRTKVNFKAVEEKLVYEEKRNYIQKNVTSLRLDSIVAAITNLSRAKAQDLIREKSVKVNHLVLEQISYLCNNNSTISIRGYGRFVFTKVLKKTKKERFVIEIGVVQ
ncbi:MAG: YlmH/Sll1252 family protein [Longicatena sp.]